MAEPTCTACASNPCACKTDVELALDALDDLMSASEPLSGEDLDAIDAWANNIQLDIMRHRRLREGSWTVWKGSRKAAHSPSPAPSPVSAATGEHDGTGEAQRGSDG